MISLDSSAALVLFSGGQDSATCLAWALDRFERVETIGFDYGQRHRVELEQRAIVLQEMRQQFPEWTNRLGGDHLLTVEALSAIGGSAMIEAVAIEMSADGLPTTFVPGRNLLFLTVAAALGYRRGIRSLVTGVCETDYSGYPDCRDDTIKALQVAINLGMEAKFVLEAPLMWLSKAQTWQLAFELGGGRLVEIIREHTHTCYLGDREGRQDWGYGCGACPACELRRAGWRAYTARLNAE